MASQENSKRFSDKIRRVVDDLQAEDELQKRITARILGAAAQMSNAHEDLINEVAEVSRHDLDRIEALQLGPVHTIEHLKVQFRTINQAKNHFGVKARSWKALVEKLNLGASGAITDPDELPEPGTTERLARIEQQLKQLQADVQKVLEITSKLINSSEGSGDRLSEERREYSLSPLSE